MSVYYLDCQLVGTVFSGKCVLVIVRKPQNVAELILRVDFCLKHYRRLWMLFSRNCVRKSEPKWQTSLTKYIFHLINLQLIRIDL